MAQLPCSPHFLLLLQPHFKYFFTFLTYETSSTYSTPHPQLKSTQQVRRHVWSEQETSYLTIFLRSHWSVLPVLVSDWTRVMPRRASCLKVYLRMMFAHNRGSDSLCHTSHTLTTPIYTRPDLSVRGTGVHVNLNLVHLGGATPLNVVRGIRCQIVSKSCILYCFDFLFMKL